MILSILTCAQKISSLMRISDTFSSDILTRQGTVKVEDVTISLREH